MDPRLRARGLVAAALAAVEAELASPASPLRREELGTCRDTLQGYLRELDTGALTPRREREEGLGRLVADSWGFDAPLAPLVLRAERAWRTC
jgi:hypothetical protein